MKRLLIAVVILASLMIAQAQKVRPYVSESICIAANGESGSSGFDAKGDYHEMKCVEADGGWEYLDHVTPKVTAFSTTSASGWLTISSSGSSVTTLSIAKNNDVICFVDKSGNARLVHGKTWRQCAELLMKYVSARF